VTAITTTTLKVVQSQKGCLYYPSVCSMRYIILSQCIYMCRRLIYNPIDLTTIFDSVQYTLQAP